nr:G protein-coupled receptor [Proales similis]
MEANNLAVQIAVGVVAASLCLIAVSGNLLVVVAVLIEKRLRKSCNWFIISLSLSDLLIGLFIMPLSAITFILQYWPLGPFMCKFWLSVDYIASTASIFNLFALSVERFLSITNPLKHRFTSSKKRIKLAIGAVWLLSSLWFVPINYWPILAPGANSTVAKQIVKQTSHEPIQCKTDFEQDKMFKVVTTLFNFYIPLVGMIVIYSKIFLVILKRTRAETASMIRQVMDEGSVQSRCMSDSSNRVTASSYNTFSSVAPESETVKKGSRNQSQLSARLNNRRDAIWEIELSLKDSLPLMNRRTPSSGKSIRLRQQTKAAQQLGILLAAFLLTWMPYFVVFIVVAFSCDSVPSQIQLLVVWLGYSNSAINPILYPFCSSAFNSAFKRVLRIQDRDKDIIKILNYRHCNR